MGRELKYIIEHLEDDIRTWCALEYIHICQTVQDQNVIFTNFPSKDFSLVSDKYHPACYTESIDAQRDKLCWDRVCLLDMNAESLLAPEDASKFDFVLFGGILGNVPSDDRTSEIRKFKFPNSRHLGSIQMTTNTAVLVTNIILQQQIPFDKIPFVDEPDLPTGPKEEMNLPFRYVAKSYFTKNHLDDQTPVFPDGMVEYLKQSANECLEEPLDFEIDM